MRSFNYILFGATGDLAKNKISPAIIDIFDKKLFPEDFIVIATGRTKYSDQDFRNYLIKNSSNKTLCQRFCRNIYYVSGDISNSQLYQDIYNKLKEIKANSNTNIYHLSILPSLYNETTQKLGESILNQKDSKSSKILIEKPFGIDKSSAKKLDSILYKYFEEKQIYRLDHYLGKDTVNNILALRFANGLFEPIWSHHFIDHIQIQILEDQSIKGREAFYDSTGALRDVVQNHALQLLSLVLMDRPKDLSPDKIRAKRQEIIYSINKFNPKNIISGQYDTYEKDLGKKSNTETFIALKLTVDKNRWENMPIYIRTGKALKRKVTKISIFFKKPPYNFFGDTKANILHLRIDPNEGIVLDLNMKKPGIDLKLENQSMKYCHQNKNKLIKPYTKLIYDAFRGDLTSFNLKQEVRASWRFIDQITDYWQKNKVKPFIYKKNTWGPKRSDKLLEEDGRKWFEPSEDFCRI